MVRRLLFAAAVLAVAAIATPARAEVFVAAELGSGAVVGNGAPSVLPSFWDDYVAGGRIGYRWEPGTVRVALEGMGSYAAIPGKFEGTDKAWRGVGGARLDLGKVLAPGIYSHVGYGEYKMATAGWRSGLTYDVGLSLDLLALKPITLGIHGDYNWIQLTSGDQPRHLQRWITWGAQLGIGF